MIEIKYAFAFIETYLTNSNHNNDVLHSKKILNVAA